MSCPPLTNKGGKLSISRFPVPCELTLPELAQLDYVVVPGVGSIGDTGIEQEISSYSTANAGVSPQSKGAAVGKAWDVEMLESQSEARDILEAASAVGNKDTYATRIEWPDGVVEFSIVQVSSPTYVKGAPSGVRIVRYTMVPSFVPIVKNPLQAPVLYAPMYDAPDTVELNWFDLSSIEDGVHVYASYSKININALPPPTATLAPNTVQYDYAFDMGEVLEERLYFRVAAFNSDAVKVSNEESIGNPANVLYSDSPTWLFANSEAGFANTLGLDTLFTDTGGTTPVEEYGDAIALAVNLADDGPDMEQATGAERLVWGRMPKTGVYPWLRNLLQNNTMAGVQTGSPGDLPPGCAQTNPQGVTRTIVGVGVTVVDGQPVYYMDVNFSGTPTTTDAQNLYFGAGGASGTTGETYTSSMYVALVDGDLTNTAAFILRYGFEAGGQSFTPDSTLRRITNTRTATGTNSFCTLRWNYQDTVTPVNFTLRIGLPQLEVGSEATAPQIIDGGRHNITESGIPSVNIAYSDTSDDNWSWDLAAGTYHLFIAGEKGCYFDTVVHAGGAFTVGPTTWTGGPADAVTNLIGQRYVMVPEYRKDEPFTQFEREQLVAYAMARGCPGVWELGSELVTNGTFDSNIDGWAQATGQVSGTVTWESGAMRVFRDAGNPNSATQPVTLGVGALFLVEAEAEFVSGTGSPFAICRDGTGVIAPAVSTSANIPATTSGVISGIITSSAASGYLHLGIGGSPATYDFDNVSLKKLTLNTDTPA